VTFQAVTLQSLLSKLFGHMLQLPRGVAKKLHVIDSAESVYRYKNERSSSGVPGIVETKRYVGSSQHCLQWRMIITSPLDEQPDAGSTMKLYMRTAVS